MRAENPLLNIHRSCFVYNFISVLLNEFLGKYPDWKNVEVF